MAGSGSGVLGPLWSASCRTCLRGLRPASQLGLVWVQLSPVARHSVQHSGETAAPPCSLFHPSPLT